MAEALLPVHRGGCHCGDVRFEFRASANPEVYYCTCSICEMTGFQHLIIPARHFTLLVPESTLEDYRFGSGTARHLFCRRCGVKSWYVPRSNPDGISVNLRCVDAGTLSEPRFDTFDGANYERHLGALEHLSK